MLSASSFMQNFQFNLLNTEVWMSLIKPAKVDSVLHPPLVGKVNYGIYKEQTSPDKPDCIFDGITKLADDGKAVDVIYLDFRKAFDTA